MQTTKPDTNQVGAIAASAPERDDLPEMIGLCSDAKLILFVEQNERIRLGTFRNIEESRALIRVRRHAKLELVRRGYNPENLPLPF